MRHLDHATYASLIKFLLKVFFMTIQELANEIGYTRTHLSLALNGKRKLSKELAVMCIDAIVFREGDLEYFLKEFCPDN